MRTISLFSSLLLLALIAAPLAAMDTSPGPTASANEQSLEALLQNLDAERAWIFAPDPDRIDPWYDYVDESPISIPWQPPQLPDLTARLLQAQRDIATALLTHHWSDALGAADAAQHLAAEAGKISANQQHALSIIAAYRAQSEQGRAYDDAHARFAALGIKVQGILWSDTGTPLAMVDGETRVLAIGDQVKDWSISAIASDRVVFRARGGNQYEFTCYLDAGAN